MKYEYPNPLPKAYDKPDQAGNIFNPADRILTTLPYPRMTITDAYQFGIAKIPTICADTENPRILNWEITANFCQYTDALTDYDVQAILKHERYTELDNETARHECETPEQYLIRHHPELTGEEIKKKIDAKEYPADVGIAYEDRLIILDKLHSTNILQDDLAVSYLTDHVAKIARELYEQEDAEGGHSVWTLDVYDTLINALPDVDYLAVGYTHDDMLQFIRDTMQYIGYTGYTANPSVRFGGRFTGKLENDMTEKDVEEFSAPTMTRKQLAQLLDANIDRIRRIQASGEQKAGAGD